jgi:hypothetical protein
MFDQSCADRHTSTCRPTPARAGLPYSGITNDDNEQNFPGSAGCLVAGRQESLAQGHHRPDRHVCLRVVHALCGVSPVDLSGKVRSGARDRANHTLIHDNDGRFCSPALPVRPRTLCACLVRSSKMLASDKEFAACSDGSRYREAVVVLPTILRQV